jgi:hypothetical protein
VVDFVFEEDARYTVANESCWMVCVVGQHIEVLIEGPRLYSKHEIA